MYKDRMPNESDYVKASVYLTQRHQLIATKAQSSYGFLPAVI
jgi:hypothetical protein